MSTASDRHDMLSFVNHWVGNSRGWTEAFLANLGQFPCIECVVLIGSAIRQRIHERSDFDLLIVYRGAAKPSLDAPIEVDIRRYCIAELDRKLLAGDEILCWALKYGIVVYDPNGMWDQLSCRIRDGVPLPSWEDADKRSRRSLELAEEMLASGDEEAASDLVLASITQIARQLLIKAKKFPASRPELPSQLRELSHHPIADLLEEAMFGNISVKAMVKRTSVMVDANPQAAL